MDCCGRQFTGDGVPPGGRRIVLAGNPNVGKSVFFNAFTGLYVNVSNYPGTTVEIARGQWGPDLVLDTPGVYGLSSFNEEERIARDIILQADLVVNVVDAVHLERDLFLTRHIIDAGMPVIVALNMVDEAKRQGLKIDVPRLEQELGVPVVPTVAVTGRGLAELRRRLDAARPGRVHPYLAALLDEMVAATGGRMSRGEALLVLEGDEEIARRYGLPPGDRREALYRARRAEVNRIVELVLREAAPPADLGSRLSHWMLQPLTGWPLLVLTMWLVYEFNGVFIAGTVVGFTEEALMQGYYEPAVRSLVQHLVPVAPLREIMVGDFGILTMTVTYILGLLLPLVAGFYLALGLLEDVGYLPRIAALVDRFLTGFGLNGRAVIPLVMGFGCVTMASITTRLLASDRERRIAIFLLGLSIPCSAQLAVIVTMLAGLGPGYAALYALIIGSLLVATGTLLGRFLPGEPTPLFIDLPPLRLPRWRNVLKKTTVRTWHFLREATPLFVIGSLALSIMQVSGMLGRLQLWLAPLTEGWLKLPRQTANAFLMGFVRRDFGAAGLYQLPLDPDQTLVALVTITIFVPCIASTLVIFKERGRREALVIWPTIFVLAFVIGGILAHLFAFFRGMAGEAVLPMVIGTVLLFLAAVLGLTGLRRTRWSGG
ncbi:MAG: ferrous iron transport protein B [Desulfotomaculales bacterium]